jgi:NAD(P)-dependent dehydrogenase (short-subunit alcohol dehydrogenase family)
MMVSLKGHRALVTGSTRGIGKAIALRLARAGADIGVMGHQSNGEPVAEEIRGLGVKAISVRADVAESLQVKRAIAEVNEAIGTIDILVNNAAVSDYQYRSGWELQEQTWNRMCDVNLKGVYLCCAHTIPSMIKGGWGRIINISSTSGINGGTSGIHYAATKGGVIALSKALALEVSRYGITVNVVAPSKIDTDMFRQMNPGERRKKTIERIPVGRLGRPEDIAEAVAYFTGENTGYTTAQVLVVSGGY